MAQKAPGKAYRKGITLAGLLRLFPDDAAAERWFIQQRWGDEPWCPHCGSVNVREDHKHPTMSHRCREKKCRKHFSVRTESIMARSKLGYQDWVIAIFLLTTSLKGVSSMKLHRDLGITQKSAWHLAHRLREAWTEAEAATFGGPVEADETYFGGKRKNMSNAKRKQLADQGATRGPAGKTAVVGVKDRSTKKVRAMVTERLDAPALQGFVVEHTANSATVYTDEATAYEGLPMPHETVKHSVKEYVRGQVHTNGIESFWSMLKRGFVGTYHKMSPKHLNRYVTEFAGRQNFRESDTITQMECVAQGMLGKRLQYDELIAPNGLDSGARGA